MPLRVRLAATAAVGAMIVLTVGAVILHATFDRELDGALTDELAIRVADLETDFRDDHAVTAGPGLLSTQAIRSGGDVVAPVGAVPMLTADELARAARGEIVVNRPVATVGDRARLLARPIGTTGSDVVVGVAATSTERLARSRERLAFVLIAAGPALTALIAGAAWLLTGAALRPVRRMAGEAATISMSEPGRRLPQPGGADEIAELGETLNGMLDRIEATLAHERAFIDDAAHELRSPLAVLRGELELAAQVVDDPDAVAEGLASALEETDRLSRLTQDLLTLARADAGQLIAGDATTDLLDVAHAVAGRIRHRDDVTIEVVGEPVVVCGDPAWVKQIVVNLVANANRYAVARVRVTVDDDEHDGLLVVNDDGGGFPPDLLPRAFDRFARGDEARGRAEGGAGLGLAITGSLARAMGGSVAAWNKGTLPGARVEVRLPLASP
jgi:two-component system OmpR family sensor kinase